jgi:hypothetical protein
MPDHGGELGGDLVPAKHSVRRSGRAAAAARSTGLRPIHFIHFIEAAMTDRVPNLLEGMRNHYGIVMFGKPKVFDRENYIRFAPFGITFARGL